MLPFQAVKIETPKGGNVTKTGELGNVIQESVQVADMYVRSQARTLGIDPEDFDKYNVHVDSPTDGGVDGPSAGQAFATLMVSVRTGIPIRKDVAMTGKIDLLGNALAIGGVKEKLLGAMQSGIKTVLIPEANVKDLEDVPQNVKNALTIIPVKNNMEVLKHALVEMPKPIETKAKVTSETGSDLLAGLDDATVRKLVNGLLQNAFKNAVADQVPANDDASPAAPRTVPAAAASPK
jgi:ATP-dependent Lon protease